MKDIHGISRHAIVSVLQDCTRRAVSSAYNAKWVLGGCGISDMYKAKRVVDRTASWGKPACGCFGIEEALFICTVNEHSTRKARRM